MARAGVDGDQRARQAGAQHRLAGDQGGALGGQSRTTRLRDRHASGKER
jgi:hypothetical protein